MTLLKGTPKQTKQKQQQKEHSRHSKTRVFGSCQSKMALGFYAFHKTFQAELFSTRQDTHFDTSTRVTQFERDSEPKSKKTTVINTKLISIHVSWQQMTFSKQKKNNRESIAKPITFRREPFVDHSNKNKQDGGVGFRRTDRCALGKTGTRSEKYTLI